MFSRLPFIRVLVLIIVAVNAACSWHASRHDPEKAAAVAQEFAKAALIDNDMNRAYGFLDDEVRAKVPQEAFVRILREMNSQGSPTNIIGIEFEPIVGEEGLNIFLTGENGKQKIYYRVPMRGNAKKGYQPIGILRGHYAKSDLRQRIK